MSNNETRASMGRDNQVNKVIGKKAKLTYRVILVLGILLFSGILIFGFLKFTSYTKEVGDFDADKLKVSVPSKILDINGKQLTEVGIEDREELEFEEYPQIVKDALISTEDRRFYDHKGMDLIRTGKAGISAVLGKLKGQQHYSEGGSTLTQQLVKLSFYDQEQTLERKAKEAYTTMDVEKRYTKDQILGKYMNKVYMANGIYGFGTASKYYYGKPLEELTLPQIAVIAGLPNSPEFYNPYTNPSGLKKRRDIVLESMMTNGKITEKEYKDAVKVDIMDGIIAKDKNSNSFQIDDRYNSAITIVLKEAEKELGESLYTDGYTINTSIDTDKEDFLDKLTRTNEIYNYRGDDDIISGIVVIDNQTGRLLAESGSSRGMEYTNQGFNYATDIERQAGSTMKPILAYAPALEYLGYTEDTRVIDEPFKYSTGQPVYNWDMKYKGDRTLRDHLAMSRNIPAIKLTNEVGLEKAYGFANSLGMGIKEEQFVESGAIGGISNASPLKMGQAFNSFANDGKYVKSHMIISIEDRDGIEIYSEPTPARAMSESTAQQVSNMLKAVVTLPEGTGHAVAVSGKDIRGKTGTTNYSDDEVAEYGIPSNYAPDSWFVGFDENYTVAVWVGYDSRKNGLPPDWQGMSSEVAREVFSGLPQ